MQQQQQHANAGCRLPSVIYSWSLLSTDHYLFLVFFVFALLLYVHQVCIAIAGNRNGSRSSVGTQIFSAIYSGSPLKELGMCNVSSAFYI
jgi:hypothetical protein